MQVRVIKEDLAHRATSAIPAVGVVGRVADDEGYDCPEGKTPVEFDPTHLGYEEDEDADPLVLYMNNDCIEKCLESQFTRLSKQSTIIPS